jgi:hypothetical protein
MTRPDLAFAYSQLRKFVQYPGVVHLQAAERVLQYVCGTYDQGITYCDLGAEVKNNVEREGSQYQTTEQEWVKISRIVEPPKVTPRYKRRASARRRKEFEDETCGLIRKAEEETVRSRMELEEHLSGASSITASEVSGGDSGLQTNLEKRKMAQVRKLQMCLSKWGLEGLTDDQPRCYFDRGSAWMSNHFKPWMQVHKGFWGQRL